MDKRHILNILRGEHHALRDLVGRARKLDDIDRALPRVLGDEIAAQVRTASAARGRLLLITPSAALATRLRMDADTVLSGVNEQPGNAFNRLDVRVAALPAPSRHRPDPGGRTRRTRTGRLSPGSSNGKD